MAMGYVVFHGNYYEPMWSNRQVIACMDKNGKEGQCQYFLSRQQAEKAAANFRWKNPEYAKVRMPPKAR